MASQAELQSRSFPGRPLPRLASVLIAATLAAAIHAIFAAAVMAGQPQPGSHARLRIVAEPALCAQQSQQHPA